MKQPTNFRLNKQSMVVISMLAEKLGVSKTDVVERAIAHFGHHLEHHPLLAFAGTLHDNEADAMIEEIYASRQNKDIPTDDS